MKALFLCFFQLALNANIANNTAWEYDTSPRAKKIQDDKNRVSAVVFGFRYDREEARVSKRVRDRGIRSCSHIIDPDTIRIPGDSRMCSPAPLVFFGTENIARRSQLLDSVQNTEEDLPL